MLYADDTQPYVSFKPDDANTKDEAIRAMEDCIKDIRNGLTEGRLLLNDDKTEFLAIGTRQQLDKLNPSVLHVGDHTTGPSVNVRNLGTIFTIFVEFLNTFHRNPLKHKLMLSLRPDSIIVTAYFMAFPNII